MVDSGVSKTVNVPSTLVPSNREREPFRWLLSLIWLLCCPGLIVLFLAIPLYYLTLAIRLPDWRFVEALSNLGATAMLLLLLFGAYTTGLASILWFVLISSAKVSRRRKIEGAVAVTISIIALAWVVFSWKQAWR